MSDPDVPEALIIGLLDWLGPDGRPYADVLDAWKTSCPRLAVWEEANLRSLVVRSRTAEGRAWVKLSPGGIALLKPESNHAAGVSR